MKAFVDPRIWDSKKLLRFGARLGLPPTQAAGYLIRLWCWAVDHQIDGDVSDLTSAELGALSGWTGDPQILHSALTEEGWIVRGKFNDWDEHQGVYIQKVLKDRARRRAKYAETTRTIHGEKPETTRTIHSPVAVAVAVPVAVAVSDTLPKENNLSPSKGRQAHEYIDHDFNAWFPEYPKGHGSKWVAYQEWMRKKKAGVAPSSDVMLAAITLWKATRQWKEGYIVDVERFVKRQLWETEAPDEPNRKGPAGGTQRSSRSFVQADADAEWYHQRDIEMGLVPPDAT